MKTLLEKGRAPRVSWVAHSTFLSKLTHEAALQWRLGPHVVSGTCANFEGNASTRATCARCGCGAEEHLLFVESLSVSGHGAKEVLSHAVRLLLLAREALSCLKCSVWGGSLCEAAKEWRWGGEGRDTLVNVCVCV